MSRRAPGEGSLYQASDGRWVGSLSLGYDSNGKRRRKVLYGETQKEVREQLDRLKVDITRGLPVRAAGLTVRELLRDFLKDAEERDRWAPSTLRRHKGIVDVHLIPALGRHRLEKLTPQHVQELLNAKIGEGLSPRSVLYIRAILRQALGRAERWGQVPRNVAKLVDPPRMRRREMTSLTSEQARQLLAAVRGDRVEALYTVAISVGLRQGEALGLRWQNVDLDAGTLTVADTLHKLGSGYELREPKTEKSRRTIALPQVAITALKRHWSAQLEARLRAERWHDWNLVFTEVDGRPLHGPTVTRRFQRLLSEIGMPRMRFHDLRHSCASLLLAQGVDLKSIQETLGHSTISVTMDTYSHLQDEARRTVADRMDEALSLPV